MLELYHFSKVTSRGSTIVRRVVERSSRVGRVCKILAANRRLNLFRSFQEVEILKHLNHPNVVQIVEYFNQHDFLYIVLEDIPGRTLHQLYLHPDLASLAPILDVLRQLLIALRFCHAAGYAHRAVHPEHVMLVRLERGRLLVKLIGFGQALKIGAPRLQPTAPRDALFAAPDAEAHPEKQDIWGCGVILLQLLSGERKFPDFLLRKDELIQTHVRRLSLEPPQRDCLLDFLQRLLAVSPERRLSAEEALAHPAMGLEMGSRVGTGSGGSEVLEKLLRFRVGQGLCRWRTT